MNAETRCNLLDALVVDILDLCANVKSSEGCLAEIEGHIDDIKRKIKEQEKESE
jgi:hypothetical protein